MTDLEIKLGTLRETARANRENERLKEISTLADKELKEQQTYLVNQQGLVQSLEKQYLKDTYPERIAKLRREIAQINSNIELNEYQKADKWANAFKNVLSGLKTGFGIGSSVASLFE